MHRHARLPISVPATLQRHVHSHQAVVAAVAEIRELLRRSSLVPTTSSGTMSSANTDAKALVANALVPRVPFANDVFLHGERKLTDQEAAHLSISVAKRLKGEPLAYVLGRKAFWSMDFHVTKDTLIPRQDSEVLIEALVEHFHPCTPLRILDIGTGTGCLLLAALSEFPLATGVGIDISPGALQVATTNARVHACNGRSAFLLQDMQTLPELGHEATALYQCFDVIVCNPPYIPRRELALVEPAVLEYEPHLALFPDGGPTQEDTGADPDGLRLYRLLHQSVDKLFATHDDRARRARAGISRHSTTKTCLLLEIGSVHQARAVQQLFTRKVMPRHGRGELTTPASLQFERFLYDARGKCRGLCLVAQ